MLSMLLVPSDRKDSDSPACLPELVPKLPVGLAKAMERALGGRATIYVGEDGPVLLDGDPTSKCSDAALEQPQAVVLPLSPSVCC